MEKVSPYKTTLDPGNTYWMDRLSKEVILPQKSGHKVKPIFRIVGLA